MQWLRIWGKKASVWIVGHKIVSIIGAIVIIGVGYGAVRYFFPTVTTTQYVLGKVTRGDIVVSITGTGQVATLRQVDIKPSTTGQTQTLGQIISVNVKNGDTVKAGDVVAILDGKNALQSLNQAKASVASAQANYDKLINGATDSDLQSVRSSVTSSQLSLQNSKQSILTKLLSAYTTASTKVYIDSDPLFINPLTPSPAFASTVVNFNNQALSFAVLNDRVSAGKALLVLKNVVDTTTLDSDLPSVLATANTNLRIIRTYFDDMTTLFSSYSLASSVSGQSEIDGNKSLGSSARSSLDSSITDLISAGQSYQSAQNSLEQSQSSLGFKLAPPTTSDVTVSKAQLDNVKATLANAYDTYASRIITAPFDGQIGGLTAQVGQQISSSDSLGKLITANKVVNVSLNEVDAAKVTANNAVALTFDALPDVTIPGHISYVDPLGTVSQGVVNYAVQIVLDDQNNEVKTGMTATAAIITESHTNVLKVPASAITTVGNRKFVMVPVGSASSTPDMSYMGSRDNATTTALVGSTTASTTRRQRGNFSGAGVSTTTTASDYTRVEVTTGVTNNVDTEILTGLTEGQSVVVRTVTSTGTATKSSAAAATSNSGFGGGAGGNRSFGGGGVRIPG